MPCSSWSTQKFNDWWHHHLSRVSFPLYSSFDIRQGAQKIAAVDANLFPAGFNNIHPQDQTRVSEQLKKYISTYYPQAQRLLLLTEEHTLNLFYWDNVLQLKKNLEQAHFEVRLAFPRQHMPPLKIVSHSMGEAQVFAASPEEAEFQSFQPELIISNNDFSVDLQPWLSLWHIPIIPPPFMGWHQRKKSSYFEHYNRLAQELAEQMGCDPFYLQIPTQVATLGDIDAEQDRKALADQVSEFWHKLKAVYQKYGFNYDPQVFIKNNSGTYGLAVTHVRHPDEILQWNWRQRKKLKAAKGGRTVTEVILQEGIPSLWRWEEQYAEPVLYFVGNQLVGHFLRAHGEKNEWDSLNAPGSRFIPRPVDSLAAQPKTVWIGQLAVLALAYEIQVEWDKKSHKYS